eukprot:1427583-Prymnesium_polylepis.1
MSATSSLAPASLPSPAFSAAPPSDDADLNLDLFWPALPIEEVPEEPGSERGDANAGAPPTLPSAGAATPTSVAASTSLFASGRPAAANGKLDASEL